MSSRTDPSSQRAELATLEERMASLDLSLERERRILTVLEKEFPAEPSWATDSKIAIRATIESMTAERKSIGLQAIEINIRLPAAAGEPTALASFKKKPGRPKD